MATKTDNKETEQEGVKASRKAKSTIELAQQNVGNASTQLVACGSKLFKAKRMDLFPQLQELMGALDEFAKLLK